MIKIFRKSKQGFTLLEVLVTMVIAAVLLSTILFSFISARQIAIRNRNRIIGMAHCTSLLEFLRNYVSGDYAAARYIEPWAGGLYALGVGTHTAPLSYEATNSFLNNMTVPWVRQYIVTDQAVTGLPTTTVTMKKVSMTVRPGP